MPSILDLIHNEQAVATGATGQVATTGDKVSVAAIGDSLMWGQGLKRTETFASLFAKDVRKIHGKPSQLTINTARSGAVLTENDKQREEFLLTFPELFRSDDEREAFLDGDDTRAAALYGEVPASLPTIENQVRGLSKTQGKSVDIVLLSGGANDIGIDNVIDPNEFSGKFIEEFDTTIRIIAQNQLQEVLQLTREKCPNAVILVFGYFAPVSTGSHKSKIRGFFKYEFDNDVKWWINERLDIVSIDRLIEEAKIRAVWAQSRAQHWMRRAVARANEDDALRGPGILFIPSGLKLNQSAFANEEAIFSDYTDPTTDPARTLRIQKCPRSAARDLLAQTIVFFRFGAGDADKARALRAKIKGPTPLIDALDRCIDGGSCGAVADQAEAELHRIQRAWIASFLHPGPVSARLYADIALGRYRAYLAMRKAVIQSERPGAGDEAIAAGPESASDLLKRFNLRRPGTLARSIGHLYVDAIGLTIETTTTSDAKLTPDMFLEVDMRADDGTRVTRQYLLNFPHRIEFKGLVPTIWKYYPHFEPGKSHFVTIDTANRLRLDQITEFRLVMGPDKLDAKIKHGTTWRPRRVVMQLNGVEVMDLRLRGKVVTPGRRLVFDYPPPKPSQPVVAGGAVA